MKLAAVFGQIDPVAVAAFFQADLAQVHFGSGGRRGGGSRRGSWGRRGLLLRIGYLPAEMCQKRIQAAVEAAGNNSIAPNTVLAVQLAEDQSALLAEVLPGKAIISRAAAAAQRNKPLGNVTDQAAVGRNGDDQLLNLLRQAIRLHSKGGLRAGCHDNGVVWRAVLIIEDEVSVV